MTRTTLTILVGLLVPVLLAGCKQKAVEAPIPTTALRAVDTPPPDYPLDLACDQVGGRVVLMVTVGPDGTATDIRTHKSSTIAALDTAAREAVAKWKFEPATYKGLPSTSKLQVPVTFTPPDPLPAECAAGSSAGAAG